MIDLYSGTPGSGKSLYACYDLINSINFGKGVIANFDINLDYFGRKKNKVKFTYKDNSELTVDFLVDYARENHKRDKEGQTFIYIDEASTMFNSRDWDAKDRRQWVKFFQQHRKLGYNVVLICQNDRMLDRQIRAFIETEWKFRAIKNYKLFGWFLSAICGGLFVRVQFWYPCRIRCGAQYFLYNGKKAKIYDTYKIFE